MLRFSACAVVIGVAGVCALVQAATTTQPAAISRPATSQAASAPAAGRLNLLRNGSFEGGLAYWYNVTGTAISLVSGQAPSGGAYLKAAAGYIQSCPVLLEDNKPFTVTMYLRADKPTEVGCTLAPSHREIAQKAKLAWAAAYKLKAGPDWTRQSFTFTPSTPHEYWWPKPVYMLQIGTGKHSGFEVDGISITPGEAEAKQYIPWRDVEVYAGSSDLKGYKDPSANLFEKGATVTVVASAFNPAADERNLTIRWQLMDYEGRQPAGEPITRTVAVKAGATIRETLPMKLTRTGMVLARVSVLAGDATIDSSDLPLCSLPYPKAADRPDWRERFGTSLWGLVHGEMTRKIGFRWSRWYPHMNWGDIQKEGPDSWNFPDAKIKGLAEHGFSVVATVYGKPKWAFDDKDPKNPLPKDMQWPADDKRWDDLTIQTAWDKFVTETIKHHAGDSIIWELENEPELDNWKDKDVYARFTIRTARLIKQANPKAVVMQDSMWPGPTPFQKDFFARGGAKVVDAFSWHEYHEGELADARTIKLMRQSLDENGGGKVEIWFDEGWTFTNTSVDEPALGMGKLTGAQSANAMVASVAEATAAGQEKTILFHTGYEDHGLSWWDYYPPGTMLWDFYGYPMAPAPAWNTLIHHVGLSERVGLVRPEGANFAIFQDLRNGRGVMVAYADRDSKADITVDLPIDPRQTVMVEDIGGNAAALQGRKLVLPANRRPCFIYTQSGLDGKSLAAALAPMDRKLQPLVTADGIYRLPATWEGLRKGQSGGNPVEAGGKPLWRLDQVWPDDPQKASSYLPMVWSGSDWKGPDEKNAQGGQPGVVIKDRAVEMGIRAAWTNNPGQKIAALVFIPPAAGSYQVTAVAAFKPWEGSLKSITLRVMTKDGQAASDVKTFELPKGQEQKLELVVDLRDGQELVFVPSIGGMHNAGTVVLKDVSIRATQNGK
jgi:hypothetical protein